MKLQVIGQWIAAVGLFFGSLLGYHQPVQNLGTTPYKPVPRFETSLALALDAVTTSSMTLVSGVDGNSQTLSGVVCFTIDSGVASKVEDVCGTASGATVSNLIRGIDTSGTTASTTLARAHRVGADVKTTDSPYLQQYYGFLNGTLALPNPLIYDASVTNASITANNQNLVSYGLLASTTIAGSVAATAAIPGIGLVATGSQLYNNLGSSPYSSFAPSNLFNGTASSGMLYQVPVAQNGLLSVGFINSLSPNFQNVNVSGTATFAGTSTFTGTTNLQISNGATNATTTAIAYSGASSSISIPSVVNQLTVNVIGAGGGVGGNSTANQGNGGVATGTISVTPGSTYFYSIGGAGGSASGASAGSGGFSGGGTGGTASNFAGGGGGGATWFSTSGSFATSSVLIAAAGGGGGGGNNGSAGGSGGLLTGVAGGGTGGGGGGTPTAGGAVSTSTGSPTAGSAGQGGTGGGASTYGGGGGGGGLYGGAGAGAVSAGSAPGGGGGSSYFISTATATSTATSSNSGNGSMTIWYTGFLLGRSGVIQFGTSTVLPITITFTTPFTKQPSCVVIPSTNTNAYVTAESTSSFTFNVGTFSSSMFVNYQCF